MPPPPPAGVEEGQVPLPPAGWPRRGWAPARSWRCSSSPGPGRGGRLSALWPLRGASGRKAGEAQRAGRGEPEGKPPRSRPGRRQQHAAGTGGGGLSSERRKQKPSAPSPPGSARARPPSCALRSGWRGRRLLAWRPPLGTTREGREEEEHAPPSKPPSPAARGGGGRLWKEAGRTQGLPQAAEGGHACSWHGL